MKSLHKKQKSSFADSINQSSKHVPEDEIKLNSGNKNQKNGLINGHNKENIHDLKDIDLMISPKQDEGNQLKSPQSEIEQINRNGPESSAMHIQFYNTFFNLLKQYRLIEIEDQVNQINIFDRIKSSMTFIKSKTKDPFEEKKKEYETFSLMKIDQ